jgi:hypothetical protein
VVGTKTKNDECHLKSSRATEKTRNKSGRHVHGAKTKFLWRNLKMTEANEQKTVTKIKNRGWENQADDTMLLAQENGQ